MIRKAQTDHQERVHVTFVLPNAEAEAVQVAGEFNGWRPELPMQRVEDGSWEASVDLERGRAFEFRYVLDGNEWTNDPAADRYVPNPYGSENSVVDLSVSEPVDEVC